MKKQTSLLTLSLMLATPALAGGGGAPAAQNPATCRSIAQIVSSDSQFSTLLTAVEAAGLTETLSSGQFTVFAPTNAAFAKLPSDQLAMILNDEEMLRSVLLYHVVPGKVSSAQVRSLTSARTAQGATVNVRTMNGRVMINNAAVTRADVAACNGVIHVIDTVLVPPAAPAAAAPAPAPAAPAVTTPAPAAPVTTAPAVTAPAAFDLRSIPAVPLTGSTTSSTTTTTQTTTTETATTETATGTAESTEAAAETSTETETTVATNTLYDVIVADERFSTLLDLLSDAGLTETLMTGEYTVFAPTNEAFAALDDATLANLAANPEVLRQVLLYHVVQGRLTAEQLASSTSLNSVQGGTLSLSLSGTTRTVNAAPVAESFTSASNGTIFVINQVLLPPGLTIPAAEAVEEAPATAEATTSTTTATGTATTGTATGTAATGTAATTTTTATVAPAAGSLAAFVTTDARFSILAELIRIAGLTETLGSGEFTLFAPTNDAFNAVPAATLTALRADPARLRQILLYHVVPGRVTATALAESPNLTTAAGPQVALTRPSGTTGARIGSAIIQGEGIATSNGTVYIIDTVLIPAGQ